MRDKQLMQIRGLNGDQEVDLRIYDDRIVCRRYERSIPGFRRCSTTMMFYQHMVQVLFRTGPLLGTIRLEAVDGVIINVVGPSHDVEHAERLIREYLPQIPQHNTSEEPAPPR